MKKKIYPGILMIAGLICIQFTASYTQYILPPLQAGVMARLGITQAGFVELYTSPMIAGVVLGLIAGLLVDRFGYPKVITLGMFATVLATVLKVFSRNYYVFLVLTICSGIPLTFVNVNITKLLSPWFAENKLAGAIGAVQLGSAAASVVATATGGLMSLTFALVLNSVIIAAAFLVWVVVLRHCRPESTEASAEKAGGEKTTAGGSVFRSVPLWITGVLLMLVQAAYLTITSSAPSAMLAMGHGTALAGILAAMATVGWTLGCVFGAGAAASAKNSRAFMAALLGGSVVLLLLFRGSASAAGAALMFGLSGFTFGTGSVWGMSILISFKGVDRNNAGMAGGFVNTIRMLGAVYIPSGLIVPLSGGDYSRMFLGAAVMFALSIPLVMSLPKKRA